MALLVLIAAVVHVVAGADDCGMLQVTKVGSEAPTLPTSPDKVRLFCFSLLVPGTYEQDLLGMQSDMNAGIFQCDKFNVYSNSTIKLGELSARLTHRLPFGVLQTTQFMGHAANTRIFVQLWRKLLDDKEWVHYDWTLKIDPDSVFLPERFQQFALTDSVVKGAARTNGTIVRNVDNPYIGIYGAMEAISQKAMQVYHGNFATCQPEHPSEDVYIWHCLRKHLHIKTVDATTALMEKQDGDQGWERCASAALCFHPFKNSKAWRECHATASATPFDPMVFLSDQP
mmetsp:Transcript_21632/g.40746  ORF Transcript_21632/g.40746 Transcript_21632/m.40746 type:complete len:285 (+) Transcript_21632:83-937(+)